MLALAGAVQWQHVGRPVAQERAHPGRSSRRDLTIESQAGRSGSVSRTISGTSGRSSRGPISTLRARSAVSASASTGRIASMRPCAKRFSAVCTPSGKGVP